MELAKGAEGLTPEAWFIKLKDGCNLELPYVSRPIGEALECLDPSWLEYDNAASPAPDGRHPALAIAREFLLGETLYKLDQRWSSAETLNAITTPENGLLCVSLALWGEQLRVQELRARTVHEAQYAAFLAWATKMAVKTDGGFSTDTRFNAWLHFSDEGRLTARRVASCHEQKTCWLQAEAKRAAQSQNPPKLGICQGTAQALEWERQRLVAMRAQGSAREASVATQLLKELARQAGHLGHWAHDYQQQELLETKQAIERSAGEASPEAEA